MLLDDLQKAYIFNLDHMPNSVSENYFSSSFTNMITKGILTFEQKFSYDEGETDSLASKMVLNLNQKPTDRGIIGQKCDFHIQKDGFEYLMGLHAGGLPEACKSKKWNDRVDLAVAMRDVLFIVIKEFDLINLGYVISSREKNGKGFEDSLSLKGSDKDLPYNILQEESLSLKFSNEYQVV
ncbi:21059_t:CDS:2 [Entrophospora sp. SA101]|nr:21059_t:CDS:2 [Entrophospora sp. SA101]